MFLKFGLAYLQLTAQQSHCSIGTVAQHIADGKETWLVVLDNAAVWRYVYLAVGECVQGIYCLVRRHSRSQMYLNLHFGSRIVVHFLSLNLAFVYCLKYRVDKGSGGF